MVAHPGPPQIRARAINAHGSSFQTFAARRYTEWTTIAGGSGYRSSRRYIRSQATSPAAMATAKPFPPEPDDTSPESLQRIRVARDPVVREVPAKLLTQGLVLFGQRLMPIASTPLRQWPVSPRRNRLLDVLRFTTQFPGESGPSSA